MAVSKERDISEEIAGFTSQTISECNCDDGLRKSKNKGGQNTRSQKKRSHGCPRKNKEIKKVWRVVTRIKSVLGDSLENEKEERNHITMRFYCRSNEEKKKCQKKENAEDYEEFLIQNDVIFPPSPGPVAK